MTNAFTTKGVESIQTAIKYDDTKNYNKALSNYATGINYLIIGLKKEQNINIQQIIKSKITKYLSRAEQLKKIVLSSSKPISNNSKQPTNNIKNSKNIPKPNNNKHLPNNIKPSSKKIKQPENNIKPPKKKPKIDKNDETKQEIDEQSEIEDEDIKKLQKSICDAIVIEKPNVKWNDVAGLDTAKDLLKEAVVLPMKFPHIFVGKRQPWSGILLYGPPGTGKSYLAKAVATEANNSTFFSISSSDLISKYVGESEKLIKNLYKLAKLKKPSIIFIDEIDSLATKRNNNEQDNNRRVKTQFLIELSGGTELNDNNNKNRVLTLAATNCPWDLDPAVRRRFNKRIYISLPDKQSRMIMFKLHVGNSVNKLTDYDYNILSLKSKGFSGSDINNVVQDALMEPIRTLQRAQYFKKVLKNNNNPNDYDIYACNKNDINAFKSNLLEINENDLKKVKAEPLKLEHFLKVLNNVKPSVSKKDVLRQIEWTNMYGQKG